jgi:hypothetical protein
MCSTDRVENEEVKHGVEKPRNILCTVNRRKAKWLGYILRRNRLLKHVIEGMIQRKRRGARRRKQILKELKEKRRYWNLKEETLDSTLR